MLREMKIYGLFAICTAAALVLVIIFAQTSYALEGSDATPPPVADVPFGEIVPDDGEGSESAPPAGPDELPPDNGENAPPFDDIPSGDGVNEGDGSPAGGVENEDLTGSEGSSSGSGSEDDKYKPDYLDSGYVDGEVPGPPSPEQNIYAIRRYMEFFLFGLVPIALAVCIIVWFCVWFYRTFIPRF